MLGTRSLMQRGRGYSGCSALRRGRRLLACAMLAAVPSPSPGHDGERLALMQSQAKKAAAARAILDAYHAAMPQRGQRALHVVSWRTGDRDPPAGQHERLERILSHIQDFYAREMDRLGLGRRSIRLVRDGVGRLVIHEVAGKGTFADYGRPDGARIRQECRPVLRAAGVDVESETVMIFTNLATWDEEHLVFRHKSPYYAGGDHRGGTAYQLDSPELDVRNLTREEPMIDDGEYGKVSLGRHNSIFIGGIAHEMGHALGLPHSLGTTGESVAYGTALMGAGNLTYAEEVRGEGKGTFLPLADGLRLASHPQFSGSVKGLHEVPSATLTDASATVTASGKAFVVSARITGVPPVYAIVGYLDPEGGSDYDARAVTAVPQADGTFTLACDDIRAGKPAALRLVACHCNGGNTTWNLGYRVDIDGNLDIEAVRVGLEMEGFLAALERGESARAEALRTLWEPGSAVAAIAATLLDAGASDEKKPSPADVPADTKTFPLSGTRPTEAWVGWQRPTYDRLPRREALLISAGRVFRRGIYAHAPARHRYVLDGRWDRLVGYCGLPSQPDGSVVFVIRADGTEVFRSKRLGPNSLESFNLDISGVGRVSLETEDGGDGKTSDWGVWFDPHLVRE